MSNKKNKKTPFKTIFADVTAKELESNKATKEDIEIQKKDNYRNQNLAFSFKYITENKKYNFLAFNKDKGSFEGFVTRLNSTLKKLSAYKVKNLYNTPFKDRFPYSNLKEGAHTSPNKLFTGTEQLISVELSSKSHERIILFHEDNDEGHNILYVLGFDLKHDMYKH